MRILAIRPAPAGSGNTLARFDVEMSPDLKLYNLKLTAAGRVFAPSAFQASVATFAPALAAEIAAAAFAALGEKTADDRRAA